MSLKVDYSATNARDIFLWLAAIATLLVLVYAIIHIFWPFLQWGPLSNLFDLDREVSIPSWYASMQLFVVGSLLFLASRNNQRRQHLPTSILITGSLFFIFLSADEGAAIHEKITTLSINFGVNWLLFKGNHGAWIPVYSILALSAVILAARQFRKLWRHFRREIRIAMLGVIVFVTGGVGLEVVSYLFLRSGSNKGLYRVEVACEEYLEMIGVSIMLYAVLLLAAKISAKNPAPASTDLAEDFQPLDLKPCE
ncbi:hypothetical protein [Desulfosarcina sp.]|uniref:hypothetical protein n=1 Tax=Desulfosarcina sp. TaxID=2027861 RepID=UPI003970964F